MKKIELLAPAGSFEKAKIAFMYGADAVYFGGQSFSLRAAAQNFSYEEMAEGVKIAREYGKKMYCTVNIMPRNSDLEKLAEHLKKLEDAGCIRKTNSKFRTIEIVGDNEYAIISAQNSDKLELSVVIDKIDGGTF